MGKFIDLTGKRFGRWTVKGRLPETRECVYWYCVCDCGNEGVVSSVTLRNGTSKSCGCLQRDVTKSKAIRACSNTRIYRIWENMKSRCLNPNSDSFHKYGARGICICSEWVHDFTSFRDWALDNGYSDTLSLDRIDNDGNYEPSNCRWATPKEQARNTRRNRNITLNGETHCFSDWVKILDVPHATLYYRWKQKGLIK